MLWPKKFIKEFDNDKRFLRLENPPPHNFSNCPSLIVRHLEERYLGANEVLLGTP